MPTLDIFNDSAFHTTSLTSAVDLMPYKPSLIGSMGLFKVEGVRTTSVMLENRNGRLSLVKAGVRGTLPTKQKNDKRVTRSLTCVHLPLLDEIKADDVQDIRAFGSETELETVSQLVARKMQAMKDNIDVTKEYQMLGAIKGAVNDADGVTEIYDLFDEFNLTQQNTNIDTASDDLKLKMFEVQRNIEDQLGAQTYTGIQVLCGADFFDNLVTMDEVKTAYERYQNGEFLRDDQRAKGFEYPRGVYWKEYRGKVGDVNFVAADKAHAFPLGVSDLFVNYNAPANFTETVNTIGKPFYVKQERQKFDTGIDLFGQANPLMICRQPGVLQLLTDTTS